MPKLSALLILLISHPLQGNRIAPIPKNALLFYHAQSGALELFKKEARHARFQAIEQALTIAVAGDAVDIVKYILSDESKYRLKNFHRKRALTLAGEFDAAQSVHYILNNFDMKQEDVAHALQWAETEGNTLSTKLLEEWLLAYEIEHTGYDDLSALSAAD